MRIHQIKEDLHSLVKKELGSLVKLLIDFGEHVLLPLHRERKKEELQVVLEKEFPALVETMAFFLRCYGFEDFADELMAQRPYLKDMKVRKLKIRLYQGEDRESRRRIRKAQMQNTSDRRQEKQNLVDYFQSWLEERRRNPDCPPPFNPAINKEEDSDTDGSETERANSDDDGELFADRHGRAHPSIETPPSSPEPRTQHRLQTRFQCPSGSESKVPGLSVRHASTKLAQSHRRRPQAGMEQQKTTTHHEPSKVSTRGLSARALPIPRAESMNPVLTSASPIARFVTGSRTPPTNRPAPPAPPSPPITTPCSGSPSFNYGSRSTMASSSSTLCYISEMQVPNGRFNINDEETDAEHEADPEYGSPSSVYMADTTTTYNTPSISATYTTDSLNALGTFKSEPPVSDPPPAYWASIPVPEGHSWQPTTVQQIQQHQHQQQNKQQPYVASVIGTMESDNVGPVLSRVHHTATVEHYSQLPQHHHAQYQHQYTQPSPPLMIPISNTVPTAVFAIQGAPVISAAQMSPVQYHQAGFHYPWQPRLYSEGPYL